VSRRTSAALWRTGTLLALALLTLAAAIAACADAAGAAGRKRYCRDATLQPDPTNGRAIDAAVVCLINNIRAAHRLPPLRANYYLGRVATTQVGEMLRSNYFADVRPSGLTPLALIASTRYVKHAFSFTVGQNLGWATGTDTPPVTMVAAWMNSPPHREIILTRMFRDVGVGELPALPSALERGNAGALYAIEFAVRTPAGPSRAPARGARNATGLGARL
jgi:uncharacterized protein YkwD